MALLCTFRGYVYKRQYYKNIEAELERAAKAAKTTPAALVEKIEHMMAEIKALNAENESLKSKAAKEALGDVMDQVVEVKGVKLLATSVAGVDMNGLRDLGDQLKGKLGEGVVCLLYTSRVVSPQILICTLCRTIISMPMWIQVSGLFLPVD